VLCQIKIVDIAVVDNGTTVVTVGVEIVTKLW